MGLRSRLGWVQIEEHFWIKSKVKARIQLKVNLGLRSRLDWVQIEEHFWIKSKVKGWDPA